MPFTLAHPAAVLPLLRRRRRWLDGAALVFGSVAPDVEYLLRARIKGTIGHTGWGLVVFDVPVALLLVLLYRSVLEEPLRFLIGAGPRAEPRAGIAAALAGATVGAATHILWDAFTHRHGWFVEHVSALHPIYHWLQHLSTVVGVVALAIYCLRCRRSLGAPAPMPTRIRFGVAVVLPALAFATVRAISRSPVGDVIVSFLSGASVGVIVGALFIRQSPGNSP
jgi:hypothetical protein